MPRRRDMWNSILNLRTLFLASRKLHSDTKIWPYRYVNLIMCHTLPPPTPLTVAFSRPLAVSFITHPARLPHTFTWISRKNSKASLPRRPKQSHWLRTILKGNYESSFHMVTYYCDTDGRWSRLPPPLNL